MKKMAFKYHAIVLFLIYAPLFLISCNNGDDGGTLSNNGVAMITLTAGPEVQDNGDETLSRIISAQVQDQFGNSVPDDTAIYFGAIDRVFNNGGNGQTNGTNIFTVADENFLTSGVMQGDILVILDGQDEGGHIIDGFTTNYLVLDKDLVGSEDNIGFVVGRQEIGSICSIAWTGFSEPDETCTPINGTTIKGTAHTRITYPRSAIWQTYYVFAESEERTAGSVYADEYSAVPPVTLDVSLSSDAVIAPGQVNISAHLYDGVNLGIGNLALSVTFSPDNIGTIIKPYPFVTDDNGMASEVLNFFDIVAGTVDVQITVSCWNAKCSGSAKLKVITSDPPPSLL